MTCHEFFNANLDNKDKCKLLQNETNSLLWQSESASEFSPMPVQDEESLLRQVISPIHIEGESKTLKPTALDDVFDKGLSVNRLKYIASEAQLIELSLLRVETYNKGSPEKPTRTFSGLASFICNEVRLLKDSDNNIALGVYDTALKSDLDFPEYHRRLLVSIL